MIGAISQISTIIGTSASAFAGTPAKEACYGLKEELDGKYSGIFNGDNITQETSEEFMEEVGHVDIELKFSNLEGGWVFPWKELQLLKKQGKAIYIKFEPYIPIEPFWEAMPVNKEYIDRIITGEYDNLIKQIALKAKEAGVPVFFTFGHEMNGFGGGRFWYPWGEDPEKFIAAWKHVHEVITTEGASNIKFVWNPHVIRGTEKDFTQYYPGDKYVDIIAFDVYGGNLVGLMKKAMKTMDEFLKKEGLEQKDYAIGEWGASPGQFEEMLSYIENDPRIKFNIYFNVKAQTGNYKMNPNMKKRYKKYLKKLAEDNFNFKKPEAKINPDIKKGICFIPKIPDPSLTIRYIPEDEFLSEAELEQQVCSAELKSFAPGCLAPFPDGFSPVTNMPPHTISKGNFNRAEKKWLDPDIGDIYDYGTHQFRLRASKIQAQIDKNNLKYETLADILRTICYEKPDNPSAFRKLTPFHPRKINREKFLAEHPEIALIKQISPNFAANFKQPTAFWENIIVLYGVYIQEAIERNDQAALKEAI
ncbi:MAG: hypothetical protein KKA31_01960, partial [Candidatus Margulisbacteria bacterium]|nr:hypothetical protein [Candidatus Margulisiibacteriota bacterium]